MPQPNGNVLAYFSGFKRAELLRPESRIEGERSTQ
jgi:hypothetical protein